MKTRDVLEQLERRHPSDMGEWLFFREAFRIDALAVACWPSTKPRRYARIGYEVKVSWSDFKREIANPLKRASGVEFTHQFYFVMPITLAFRAFSEGLIPPECGLLEVYEDGKTRVRVRAPITDVPAMTERHLVYLLRRRANPYDLQQLRRMASYHEGRSTGLLQRNEAVRAERDRAYDALERRLRTTVEPGQIWVGPWPGDRWNGVLDEHAARVVVKDIEGWVLLHREDRPDLWPSYRDNHRLRLGEFLAEYLYTGEHVPFDAPTGRC